MKSAIHFFADIDVICDIGGQDIKVLFMHNGEIRDFRLSNQCSAGNGMLLQAMADQFGVPLASYAETAFRAKVVPVFSYGCAVFLDSDRVNFQSRIQMHLFRARRRAREELKNAIRRNGI